MSKKEYKEKVGEILKGYRYGLGEEDIEELLELIMAVPFPDDGGTYFPHKKKVLDRSAE
ncbi:hypothetical protein ES705_14601 [subsurface metagenome]